MLSFRLLTCIWHRSAHCTHLDLSLQCFFRTPSCLILGLIIVICHILCCDPKASGDANEVVAAKDAQLAAKDEEIASKDEEIASKDEAVASKIQEIAAKDEEIAALGTKLEASLASAGRNEDVMNKHNQEIAAKDEQIAARDDDIATLGGQLEETKTEYAAAIAKLQDSQQDPSHSTDVSLELQAQLDSKNQEVESLRETAEEATKHAEELAESLDSKEKQCVELTEKLAQANAAVEAKGVKSTVAKSGVSKPAAGTTRAKAGSKATTAIGTVGAPKSRVGAPKVKPCTSPHCLDSPSLITPPHLSPCSTY